MTDLYGYDRNLRLAYGIPAGVDEAGRGPIAGPLVASAVILNPDFTNPVLTDSKKLTDKRRRELFPLIEEAAAGLSTGLVTAAEIDAMGMGQAVRTSFKRATEPLKSSADVFLIDGNPVSRLNCPCIFVVKGDSKSLSIAAASVIAKVTRDDIMLKADNDYPGYGFASHKGYGTEAHIEALQKHGPSPLHRMCFEPLKSMFPTGQLSLFPHSPPISGRAEERIAARHYTRLGYSVLAANWRCSHGEIDLILKKEGTVVFVEVKSSSKGYGREALGRIGNRKKRRIHESASIWIAENRYEGDCLFQCALVTPGGIETIPFSFDTDY